MGYTHYWDMKGSLSKTEKDAILLFSRMIVEEFKDILRQEYDEDKPPVLNQREIRFNGFGEFGYETFYLKFAKGSGSATKTDCRAYDLPLCMILAVTKAFAGDRFDLRSDGFGVQEKNIVNNVVAVSDEDCMQYWGEATERLEKWGFQSLFVLKKRRSPYATVTLEIQPPFQILENQDEK